MGTWARTAAGMEQLGFVRGPARILAAPLSQAPPTQISDIVKLSGTPTNEVQTLTVTGTPTGGTFRLAFNSVATANIAFNASAAAVQSALELISTIGAGNVAATGGPLPTTAVVITFQNNLAAQNVPLITATGVTLTGGTTPGVTIVETTPGTGIFDPVGSWFDLGATKNGVVPTMNNTEDEFTIDQQKVAIGVLPNEWTWSFTTSLVQVTPENLALTWDMGGVTLNTAPTTGPEKQLGMGAPDGYTQRRIAILHRRPTTQNNLIRCHFFRKMIRQAAESMLTYQSTGDQQSVAFQMRALVDDNITDLYSNVGLILDQTQ